ncbi:MAG: NAD(P)-binding protein [Proteobacteria bacterium]|nr:NAD(P)-binding protein [Pseudomonadota bacterium]
MARDPRYDILFEPVRIGPVTAKNRFYQVPHCNGMGHRMPRATAAMRGVKAEGGWAVVCTEECEIHPSGDVTPAIEARLWDDRDIPTQALMVEAVHEHGALAGIELTHNGPSSANRYSREVALGPSHQPIDAPDPVQARAMDKADIRAYRRWHRAAALRAKKAGFDIVIVYAGHDLSLAMHFLQRRRNDRSDEYGGSLENRARLLRELIEETKEAVGDTCAVAVRMAVDELMGPKGITSAGEGREVIEMLAELPDLWDVNVSDWSNDSPTSRFAPEGAQEHYVAFVKQVTSKPVVGVGRFTSPDAMVSQVRRGVLDMIGAARPSIADPFLPKKIEEGRLDDIRECIGCNICVSGDMTMSPIRCTQNPTMGEEWRKGWHPEAIPAKGSDDTVLVVGAGPAGLECARALGQRGYRVHLAEAGEALGGRVAREARLPGLAEWIRVRDYRVQQLDKMTNVEVYRASRLEPAHVIELGAARVIIATGSRWRRDGIGRAHSEAVPGFERPGVYTPDDLMAEAAPEGPVVVFDDDHYYMGGVLAEKLRRDGLEVTLVTPALAASYWTEKTLEIEHIHKRLLELEIAILPNLSVVGFDGQRAELACVFTARRRDIPCASIVTVTARLPEAALYRDLMDDPDRLAEAGIRSVAAIGDALAPGSIAAAVYAGHRAARELDAPPIGDAVPFERELPL